MTSRRESVLSALHQALSGALAARVVRNEVLPEKVASQGLVIVRDGEPGEPDVTLNPCTEYYAHRAEIEAYVPRPPSGGGEAGLDALIEAIASALRPDPSLGGLCEMLNLSAPETNVLAIEGAAPFLGARLTVTLEYLVSDPLTP
jgi:hypothetical protein